MIAVLVSTRIDPVSGRATRSSCDAAAVELAARLDPAPRLVTAGEMSEAVAREYLAIGVPTLTVLRGGPADANPASALAQVLGDAELVFAGARSEGGLGSGLLPYEVAHALGRPIVADVIDVQRDGSAWIVRQALPRGARRRLRITAPAVLVLSERADRDTRHAFDAAQRGRIETRDAPAATPAPTAIAWQFEPARRQRRPLAARSVLSAHARMAGATGTAAGTPTAGTVLREGSAEDKARALLEHLRAQALIFF
jgi:electron transfer flavoprotein beta subunit